jgi:outer membrane protein
MTSTRIQRFNVDSSEAEIENITIQIIFNVKQAYYNLIKAKRNRDVSAEIVRQFEEHLLQAKGFYEAGTRPRYDVTQAEVNLSNARVNLIRAENNVRLALAALNNAMGVTDIPEYDIEDDLFYNKYEVTFDEALSVALRSRPDLRSLISRRRAAEESLELARRNYYPTLSGSVTYGWSGSSFPLEREWNLGASLSFPVFSGFLTRYQVSEAEANLNAIKADEELLRQKIFLDLQQTYLNLREAEERIPATELAVRQATENLEIARGRYEAGVGSPIEVTDAEVSYANAKASYIQALTDYRIAIADLERAIGKKD